MYSADKTCMMASGGIVKIMGVAGKKDTQFVWFYHNVTNWQFC